MFGLFSRQVGRAAQKIANPTRSSVRPSSHGHAATETVPGENLPFSIDNPYKLTLYFTLFFGSAFGAPFLMLRHQILKH